MTETPISPRANWPQAERSGFARTAVSRNIAAEFIDEPACRYPSRIAIVGDAGPTSYGDLARATNAVAAIVHELGCRRGDRVLLAIPDSQEFITAFFGVSRLGALAVPVSPLSHSSEFAFYLRHAEPKIAIVHRSALPELRKARGTEQLPSIVIEPADDPGNIEYPWNAALQSAGKVEWEFDGAESDPVALLYTSGSTGIQKAAIHSHRNLLAAARNVGRGVFGFGEDDRMLSLSRLTFSFGLAFGGYYPLSVGGSTVLHSESAQLATAARLLAEHRPTILSGVPSALAALLKASRTWLELDASSLRFIVSAGEPLSIQLMEGYRQSLGIEVLDGLGSSEMATHFISNRPGEAKPGSCGRPVPGCELKLLDDDGQAAADGEAGALWVRCETAFAGYWKASEGRGYESCDGWHRTGDWLCRDGDGYYHFVGRGDDMLKSSGIWVSSREVEAALRECSGVESVAVTAKTDPDGVNRLVAYITAGETIRIEPASLMKRLSERLPAWMMPAAYVFLDRLPLTINGKLSRSALPEPRWQRRPA